MGGGVEQHELAGVGRTPSMLPRLELLSPLRGAYPKEHSQVLAWWAFVELRLHLGCSRLLLHHCWSPHLSWTVRGTTDKWYHVMVHACMPHQYSSSCKGK